MKQYISDQSLDESSFHLLQIFLQSLTSFSLLWPQISIILICKLSYYSTCSSLEFNYNQLNAKVFYHMKYCFSSSLIEFDWNQFDAQVLLPHFMPPWPTCLSQCISTIPVYGRAVRPNIWRRFFSKFYRMLPGHLQAHGTQWTLSKNENRDRR